MIEVEDATQPNDDPDSNHQLDHDIDHISDDDEDQQDDDLPDLDDENTIHVFREHKEPVLKVCLSRCGDFVVTGGQDDAAFVWRTATGDPIFSCAGHRDSVNCVSISCKDTFVATADMSGLIQVFSVPDGEKVFEYEVDDIHWLQWHPLSNSTLLIGTESGSVWLLNVQDVSKIKTLPGPGTATTCGKMSGCGTRLMTGYEDGSVRMWDLKSAAILFSIKGLSFSCHRHSLLSLSARPPGTQRDCHMYRLPGTGSGDRRHWIHRCFCQTNQFDIRETFDFDNMRCRHCGITDVRRSGRRTDELSGSCRIRQSIITAGDCHSQRRD